MNKQPHQTDDDIILTDRNNECEESTPRLSFSSSFTMPHFYNWRDLSARQFSSPSASLLRVPFMLSFIDLFVTGFNDETFYNRLGEGGDVTYGHRAGSHRLIRRKF